MKIFAQNEIQFTTTVPIFLLIWTKQIKKAGNRLFWYNPDGTGRSDSNPRIFIKK